MYQNQPPFHGNNGYQPEGNSVYKNQAQHQPSIPTITPSYVSPMPQHSPQVSPHQSVAPYKQENSKSWCSSRKNWIICVIAVFLFLAAAIVIIVVPCWYFLVRCEKRCGTSSRCILDHQWCDGIGDCPNGADEANCARLYGQNFILQAYHPAKSSWLSVCSDDWDSRYGPMVCQSMGYKRSSYYGEFLKNVTTDLKGFASINTSVPFVKLYQSIRTRDSCPSGNVISLRCIDCGQSTKQVPSNRIVGGTEAQSGDWPWQVSLQIGRSHACGGSIITPEWIVTAAHCVQGDYSVASVWTVYAGSILKFSGQRSNVESIISHPNYDPETQDNDIALMKLKTSLPFTGSNIKPVCLPNAGMPWSDTQSCWISGWGYTIEDGTSPNELMQANVPLISPSICNAPAIYDGHITSNMICAGYVSGGIDSCQGDSGGPLVTKTNNLWWLVGDTSWGIGCARQESPGVYGNVTVFLEWIYHQMQLYT